MAEANVSVPWHALLAGDQLLKDGVVAYTILGTPLALHSAPDEPTIIGYKVKNADGRAEIIALSDPDRIVSVRRN